ncbi:MAG: glycoside hydrolase family 43 protein, partial [Kiritimatiellae bacterium]|nr:glycoside hydrolase family 43 protein [Kiritimatiellia bacterium]
PRSAGQEAGLCVYRDHRHHCELFVEHQSGDATLVLRQRIGRLAVRLAERPCAPGPLILRVEADDFLYRFSFRREADAAFQPIGEAEVIYLSTEVAGGFTGVYLGLFAQNATGDPMPPADFDWFALHPRKGD